ncbi:putative oxidoreductase CipA [Amylocarpus encephaloides]|uniref:Oxidoreductase CipA n=1 Tax=Amylocarpus encephaloides TaxID=45428 RepID=A0A9P7YIT5_9HELO|nr:putative oxidoreductase CipA [Amylocarpus encephaloides]
MSQRYANSRPSGFQNHLKNIALVGAGGSVGSHILTSLLSAGKHNITILTRPESTNTFPPNLTVKQIDYTSPSSLASALQGQQCLIITLSFSTPPEHESALIAAAASAGVQYIIPNEWGQDFQHPGIAKDILFLGPKLEVTRKLVEKLGMKWLVVSSGFWYEYSLAGTEWRYGFDFKEKTVTMYGDGDVRINTSTWPQIGRAVAALLSLKLLPEDKEDKSEGVLSKFANRNCYISSFLVSQKDMWASARRVTGTKEGDWTVTHEGVEERFKRGIDMFQKGEFKGFMMLMYARSFFADGAGNYETSKGLSNDLLGLPKEDFDECTKGAVERAEKMAGTY